MGSIMAVSITLTITNNADAVRVGDAFAATFGWESGLGVTKTEFVKRQLMRYMKQVTAQYEADLAAATSNVRQQAADAVEAMPVT